jgi:hypothetical protein
LIEIRRNKSVATRRFILTLSPNDRIPIIEEGDCLNAAARKNPQELAMKKKPKKTKKPTKKKSK